MQPPVGIPTVIRPGARRCSTLTAPGSWEDIAQSRKRKSSRCGLADCRAQQRTGGEDREDRQEGRVEVRSAGEKQDGEAPDEYNWAAGELFEPN